MLRVRWLGKVRYRDAHALQRGLFERSPDDHLLLLEHPHVFTLGVRANEANVLVDPASVGAEVVRTDRGGDVTYHGPGQLVGYPILTVPDRHSLTYVRSVEQLIIDTLADLGLPNAGRLGDYPGVWLDPESDHPRKVCAIGVKLTRGRTMHGFALNVDPDMRYLRDYIVPCGIADKAVTSLAEEGIDVTMQEVVDALTARATERWGHGGTERQDVAWRHRPEDLSEFSRTGVATADLIDITERKPEFVKARFRITDDYLRLKKTMRELSLVTVCEEAGCPNIFECWADGTATFMINGERCTRACGFCLVDTRRPEAPDPGEPERVAEAVERMGLSFAVVTTVARDDLPDGGAGQFAATIAAIRRRCPDTRIEVLIADCKGNPEALQAIFDAQPDVLNHNMETVARLQRPVRPSASYARSLAVLARAKDAGLTAKSGLILGMGETEDEVVATLADLHAIGVDIVTLGQYLRPTSAHLPVAKWWTPEAFERLKGIGEAMGIAHVEASPLTRSSHHARQAAERAERGLAEAVPVTIGVMRSATG